MPSDQSTWLIAVPADGDSLPSLQAKLPNSGKSPNLAPLPLPQFKTGTLESLVSLSEELPKYDASFTATVAKSVDTLRNLLNNDPAKLAQHIQVNEEPVDTYLLHHWHWNDGRYGTQRPIKDMVDVLNKEMSSIDNVMKVKLNTYNLAKGQLVQLQRKKTGNLSVRSLADVVHRDNFVLDSEFLETVLVAVPRNLVKDWTAKYERLAPLVVPRSATQLAADDEYALFAVVLFKKSHDAFAHQCRESRYVVRDFAYSDALLERQREELASADSAEKELWTELLRLARTNFSEAFQILVHLKVLRLFVESVLRYGLPASYSAFFVKPEPKATKRTLSALQTHFARLGRRASNAKTNAKTDGGEGAGEYQALLEQEYFDFVLFEVPWIVF
ncbi:hypothetical protein BKA93DRAFT_784421 [Sparassis latifolia]